MLDTGWRAGLAGWSFGWLSFAFNVNINRVFEITPYINMEIKNAFSECYLMLNLEVFNPNVYDNKSWPLVFPLRYSFTNVFLKNN